MSLDDLLETIKTLQGRISAHGDMLRQDELRTRYALIDPLLRCLGWDTEDPTHVVLEERLEGGKPDYALLGLDGHPAVVVEARLGSALRDATRQVINYCIDDGIDYFAVTDGRHWELYETHRPVPLAEKRVTSFDLAASPAEMCLRALALWRPSVLEGHLQEAVAPVVEASESMRPPVDSEPPPSFMGPDRGAASDAQDSRSITRHRQGHARPDEPSDAWVPLGSLDIQSVDSPPSQIWFPDGTIINLNRRWNATILEATRWIEQQGALPVDRLPLWGGSRQYILARSAYHEPKGEPRRRFDSPRQFGGVFLEANGNGLALHRKLLKIIEHAGMNPAHFRVLLQG